MCSECFPWITFLFPQSITAVHIEHFILFLNNSCHAEIMQQRVLDVSEATVGMYQRLLNANKWWIVIVSTLRLHIDRGFQYLILTSALRVFNRVCCCQRAADVSFRTLLAMLWLVCFTAPISATCLNTSQWPPAERDSTLHEVFGGQR